MLEYRLASPQGLRPGILCPECLSAQRQVVGRLASESDGGLSCAHCHFRIHLVPPVHRHCIGVQASPEPQSDSNQAAKALASADTRLPALSGSEEEETSDTESDSEDSDCDSDAEESSEVAQSTEEQNDRADSFFVEELPLAEDAVDPADAASESEPDGEEETEGTALDSSITVERITSSEDKEVPEIVCLSLGETDAVESAMPEPEIPASQSQAEDPVSQKILEILKTSADEASSQAASSEAANDGPTPPKLRKLGTLRLKASEPPPSPAQLPGKQVTLLSGSFLKSLLQEDSSQAKPGPSGRSRRRPTPTCKGRPLLSPALMALRASLQSAVKTKREGRSEANDRPLVASG